MTIKHIAQVILSSLLVLGCVLPFQAQAKEKVYWGGVSFAGWEYRDKTFPIVASTLCRSADCSTNNIDSFALASLDKASFHNFDVSMDYISTGSIEGVIMTPMITGESLNIVKDVTAGQTKYIHTYRIFATLTFFEFGTGRFIAAKPVIKQFTDTLDAPASTARAKTTFLMLLSGDDGDGLFDALFESAALLSVTNLSDRYVRISGVSVSTKVLTELAITGDVEVWSSLIAKNFESNLVKDTGAPFVPFSSNSELTSELSATFANGSQTIRLPTDVPYSVAVSVDKVRELESVDRRAKTVCHAVVITLQIKGPFESLLSQQLMRAKESCGVVSVDKNLDPNYYFTQSLLSLLTEVSRNLNEKPDKEFFKRAAPKSKNVHNAFSGAWQEAFKSAW